MKAKKRQYNFSTHNIADHLQELRERLLKIFFLFLLFAMITFQFSWEIFNILAFPLIKICKNCGNFYFIYTKLTEGFLIELKISFITSIFLILPFIIFQLYRFFEPGLHIEEKKILLPCIIFPPILFTVGILVVYYIIIPITWKFFIRFQNIDTNHGAIVILNTKVTEYVDLVLELFLGFGIAFQLPIILVILARLDIVQYIQLQKFRRYAIVLIFILAAILTPPDILSQLMLALPLVLLYEISIILCKK